MSTIRHTHTHTYKSLKSSQICQRKVIIAGKKNVLNPECRGVWGVFTITCVCVCVITVFKFAYWGYSYECMYWSCWCSLSVGEITSSPRLMLSAFHHRKWQAALLSERCNVSCGGKSLHNWNQLFLLSVMKSHEQVLKGWCHRWTANHCICEAKHYWAPHRVLKSIVGFSVVRITYGCFWQKQQHPSWCAGFSHREVTVSVFTSHSEKYPLHPPTPNLTLSLECTLSLTLSSYVPLRTETKPADRLRGDKWNLTPWQCFCCPLQQRTHLSWKPSCLCSFIKNLLTLTIELNYKAFP